MRQARSLPVRVQLEIYQKILGLTGTSQTGSPLQRERAETRSLFPQEPVRFRAQIPVIRQEKLERELEDTILLFLDTLERRQRLQRPISPGLSHRAWTDRSPRAKKLTAEERRDRRRV